MKGKKISDIENTPYLWELEGLYLGGQPTPDGIVELAARGVRQVINLRSPGEFDDAQVKSKAEELGLNYIALPIMGANGLMAEVVAEISSLVEKESSSFVHCASGNRVAGWLIVDLVKNKGLDFEQAIEVASSVGLTNPGFIDQAEALLDN